MKATLVRCALLVVPMLLAACGGGGGGGGGGSSGGGSSGGGSTVAGVVITTANSQAVAAEAVEISTNTDAAAAGSMFVTGVQVAGSAGPNPMTLAGAARLLAEKAQGTATLATGVATTEACSAGGTITLDVNTSGSGVMTAGDSIQITANKCAESDGTSTIVMDGSMAINIISGSFDPASALYPKSVTMRMVTTNFSVTGGGESELFNGDLTMALTQQSASSGSVTLTANSLASTIGTHSVTVFNYSMSVSENASGSTMNLSATVQTNNSRLGASPVSYSISMPTPITVSSTGAITAGAIKVTGANSSLLLTVTSSDSFSLQVDTNGDGSYDSTSPVTRSQLQALI
jgi:hypothetical protein